MDAAKTSGIPHFGAVPPGFKRWADLIVGAALRASDEMTSVREMADACRLSVRTFEYRCESAGVSAKTSARFIRCLRLVLEQDTDWMPARRLSASDPRTVRQLMQQAGFIKSRPAVATFLSQQQFIVNPLLLEALTAVIVQRR
jgi:hypothetical protein